MLEKLPARDLSPTQRVAMTGMAAAVTAVVTSVVKIPTPATGGYLNLGDVTVIFLAFLLGPRAGAVAGALGSAAADLIGGFAAFVPITLLAKGAEGALAGLAGQPGRSRLVRVVGATLAGVVMALAYAAWDYQLLGAGPALAGLPGNLLQGAVGTAGALALLGLVARPPPGSPARGV